MKYLGIVLCMFLLVSCGTTGKRTDIDIRITVTAQGDVAISPLIDQESLMGDVRDLSTSYDPNVPVDLNFSLTPEQQLVEAGKSLAAAKIVKEAIAIEEDTDEVIIITPDNEKIFVPPEKTRYSMEYLSKHNRSHVWFPWTGKEGRLVLAWPECNNELHVPDGSQNYRIAEETTGNYFDGTHNEFQESNGRRASSFGPLGCEATYVIVSGQ